MFLLDLWKFASKLNKINFEKGFSELACQPTCHIKRVWIKGLHSPDQSHVTQCNSMTAFLASKQYDFILNELSEFLKVTEVKLAAPQLRWRTPTHEHGNHVGMKVIIPTQNT